jgi:hypothetical protein
MARANPTSTQKERLLQANAFRCCVCKRRSVGVHLHHIDGNSSNTVDENLAVLCVEDHDRHHRPDEYESRANHLELDANEILRLKNSWEAFVVEANRPDPRVIATLSAYGTEEVIHSLQLVMQWPDERIEYKRSFHLGQSQQAHRTLRQSVDQDCHQAGRDLYRDRHPQGRGCAYRMERPTVPRR